ncbi:hypothetical protein GCM10027415_36240 [Humibacter ginsengisoli]
MTGRSPDSSRRALRDAFQSRWRGDKSSDVLSISWCFAVPGLVGGPVAKERDAGVDAPGARMEEQIRGRHDGQASNRF